MFYFIRSITCSILFVFSSGVFAFQCPYTILVSESVSPQAGWSTVKISSAKTLSGWTIYEGSLGENQFSLAPKEIKNNNKLIQFWDLRHRKHHWIQCHYFETSVSMSQVIPKTVKQCKSVLELDKHHNIAKSSNVDCA